MTDSRYDRDPDALAWAAAKVEKALERVEGWAKDAKEKGDWARAKGLGVAAMSIRGQLLGRGPCVIGAFDARRPAIQAAMDVSSMPPVLPALTLLPEPTPDPRFCHHPNALPSARTVHRPGWGTAVIHALRCPDCGQYAEALHGLPEMAPTPLPPLDDAAQQEAALRANYRKGGG